ncbi:MAG TPA: PAS domain S-box protein [Bacteroidales bacterium]|nr:PAS domain S-box protein [Bacteroidales bacterium]
MKSKSPKVLIVDDDQDLLISFEVVLKKGGYEVYTASCISEATEKVYSEFPDIIYIDRILGDEDGLNLLKKLKQDKELKHLFKVLISGQAISGTDISEGLSSGADGYLKKPINNKELLAQTNNFLRQRSGLVKIYYSEQRLSKIINSNPDAIIILSKEGTIRFANPAAEKLIKNESDSLSGIEFGMPTVSEGSAELVLRSELGYEVIASMNFVEEQWEGEEVYIATLRDITEKKQAEEKAEQLNSLLKAISKVNQLIAQIKDVQLLFDEATKELQRTRDYKGVAIGLYDKKKGQYHTFSNAGEHYFPLDWTLDASGQGNAPQCIKEVVGHRQLIICNDEDFCENCSYNLSQQKKHVVVNVAMLVEKRVEGVLSVTMPGKLHVSKDEQNLLKNIAEDLAFAYDKIRLSHSLEKKESQYQQLFERSPVGIFQTTSDGKVIRINSEMARILDFGSVEEALEHYDNLRKKLYVNPGQRDEFIALLKKQGTVQRFVYEALSSTGQRKWITMNATIGEYFDDGTFLIDGFATDITKERQNQQRINLSEKKYRNLFNSIRDAVLVADTERKIIDCNEKFTELFGYEFNELEGKFTQAVYGNQEDYKDMGNVLANFDGGDSVYKNIIYKKKNGETFPGETHVFSITDEKGNPSAYVGMIRDISHRLKTYESLAESEQRFRKLYNSSGVGITVLSTELTLEYANKAFCKFLNYSEEEIKGQKLDELCENKKSLTRNIEQLKNGEKSFFELENRFTRKDGAKVWGMIHMSLITDSSGNVLYYLGDVVDTDKQKITEEKLREQIEEYQSLNEEYQSQNEEYEVQNEELNESLQRIREMNEELREAKIKAEENDRLKSAFLANMSHEIRTPMNAIIGFSDLLLCGDVTSEERDKYLNVIMQKGNSLLRLIDMIIDTAKIEGQQLKLLPEKFEVNSLIDEVYETNHVILEKDSKKNFVELRMNKAFPEDNIYLKMDTGRLKQIFNNLISNAIKYTRQGTIELGYTANNRFITFFVSDTGVGIGMEEQPYVFERFRRGENQLDLSTRKLIGGTGLGLSIVKDLTELMGGQIQLQSEEGQGTTFFIEFPLNKEPETTKNSPEVKSNQSLTLKGQDILLVEDDPDNMEYLNALMKKTGGNIHRAIDGNQALEEYQHNKNISIVLMDIKLPGMDGYEATRRLKSINPDLKIIAQTAHAMAEDVNKAKEAGCDSYISKPINKADLYALIRKLL